MLKIVEIPTTVFMQMCRLLINTDKQQALIVDPGEGQPIVEACQELQVKPQAILITHGHLDHVGGVAALLKTYPDLKVYGPTQDDQIMLKHLQRQAASFGIENSGDFTTAYVSAGQVLEPMAGCSLKVLHTPGHTPGGVCYYCEKENFVLVGDTLFAGSIGRTDFPGGDFDAICQSICQQLYTLPDDTKVLCGHGPDTSIGQEKEHNLYVKA